MHVSYWQKKKKKVILTNPYIQHYNLKFWAFLMCGLVFFDISDVRSLHNIELFRLNCGRSNCTKNILEAIGQRQRQVL